MGLNNFDIQFEKPLKIFFSGEELRGRVLIDLSSEKKFKQISVEIVGRGEVHWTEMRTVTRREGDGTTVTETVTDHYRGSEKYFHQEFIIQQGPGLPPGRHVLPFSVILPSNLPSSFEGEHGSVRYYVKANIVRDWKWDHKVKQHIMVNGICDLNLLPGAKQEGQY